MCIRDSVGVRFADFEKIKTGNIEQTEKGYILKLETQKNQSQVVIPIKPIVMIILAKYNGRLPRIRSIQIMNKYIKEVGKMADIDQPHTYYRTVGGMRTQETKFKFEFISMHTARRSFATNAYLAGIPSASIMKITGHKTEKNFRKYIRISDEENAMYMLSHDYFSK